MALTYGEFKPSAPLNGQLLEPSAPRLALTFGELNPSASLNGELHIPLVSCLALIYGDLLMPWLKSEPGASWLQAGGFTNRPLSQFILTIFHSVFRFKDQMATFDRRLNV